MKSGVGFEEIGYLNNIFERHLYYRILFCSREVLPLGTGTQLLIVIIDATWNVNACYYEVSYASARSLRMRHSTSSALGP